MNIPDPSSILFNLVKSQLSGNETFDQVETQVRAVAAAASIDDDIAASVIEQFRAELKPPEPTEEGPRLLVDWGDLPKVGYQVRPEFSLLCAGYTCRPEIAIKVDRDLDHDADDPLRRPKIDEPGLWSFHVPFRMTSEGMDCRPGQYLIDVEVMFREVTGDAPRFFRTRIRLNVPDASSDQGGVLEIDGDGQSMVNLQGYNLKQFSKVVLKGGEDSVINLQNAIGQQDETSDSENVGTKPQTTFEYQLKVDSEKQSKLPKVHQTGGQRAYLDACGFTFDDGRRSLVFARPRLSFGRSRDNDVVLRFLPAGEANNNDSRNISRTHFIAELINDGIEIRDESRSGIELNYSVVQQRDVVPTDHLGEVTSIQLGVTGTVPKSFEMEMVTFGPDRFTDQHELEFWHELYSELIGGRLSRLAREGLSQRLDAVRFDRVGNLAGEESYVLLTREAMIGGSRNQCAIVLNEHSSMPSARLLHLDRSFWIESLSGVSPVAIDGQTLLPGTLQSLSPGMQIQFGGETANFDRPSQMYLS